MVRRLALVLLLLSSPPALLASSSETMALLREAWPTAQAARVSEVGRGVGVVFSPDLSVPQNCRFYEALGFACFQDADWGHVLQGIHRFNTDHPDRRIYTLVLETHGTNGNGLKLQNSYSPTTERSYISVGALQQYLEPEGVYYVIISACNSQRLLRPYIYKELDPYNGDKLFLPATCGIYNASEDFEPSRSAVTVITPQSSHIETTLVGSIRELRSATRKAVLGAARARHLKLARHFAISDVMMQLLTRDPRLQLTSDRWVEQLSGEVQPVDRSEELYRHFMTYLNAVTIREAGAARGATLSAKAGSRSSR